MNLQSILDWFAGGSGASHYMRLADCMAGDRFWIALTVCLDLAVAAGYMLIAMHWWRNSKMLPGTPARAALNNMRNIFLFCGICGYAFIPIKMVWPAWRLYDMFMIVLVYFTWQYAWSARDLKVIYSELGRTEKLANDLDRTREESRQKSIFLNSISHDLRTPLNGLVLQTNVARNALAGNDAELVRESLNDIEACVQATSAMLDNLLEYGRVSATDERNEIATFSLQALVEQIFRIYQPTAMARGVTLASRVTGHCTLMTDKLKLERVLNNLVHNAIKFSPNGSVTVDVEYTTNAAEIHVIDTGIGISEEDQRKLFNEFFQVHNVERDRAKGFGLGLAIARRLTLQLGGDLTVESALGKGARFSILLPGAVAKEASAVRDGARQRAGVVATS